MPRLLVIGTGLIGGSFALAMRQAGCFTRIDGHDADASVTKRARKLGVIDAVASDEAAGIAAADAVLIAVPTAEIAGLVGRIATQIGRRSVTVFDVGSVKGSVLDELRRGGGVPPWFVPSHPMAGSEHHGPDAADANLFRNRQVIVTPQPESDRAALDRVAGWWRAAGANVVETSAKIHDEMVALTSHLPHLIAYAFMNWVDGPHSSAPRDFTGPGLKDFTRIAASDAHMWRQILAENRSAVLAQYDGWTASLGTLVEHLRNGRFDELEKLLANAQAARGRLTDQSND
jgi:prephenate dehydrogenase